MKTKFMRIFCLIMIVAILAASTCFAVVDQSQDIITLSDFIKYNGVELKENSTIRVIGNGEKSGNGQYIEVTNFLPNNVIEKTIMKPYSVLENELKGVSLINASEGYISPDSTGYVDVNFGSVNITVTTQAYYTGSPFYGLVPSGVTAKWTRVSGTTNVVSNMTAEFFIRGVLIDIESGNMIQDNYVYLCMLDQKNPSQHLYYSEYKVLPESGTGIVIGAGPEYGAGVIVTIIVNGVSYEDSFGI